MQGRRENLRTFFCMFSIKQSNVASKGAPTLVFDLVLYFPKFAKSIPLPYTLYLLLFLPSAQKSLLPPLHYSIYYKPAARNKTLREIKTLLRSSALPLWPCRSLYALCICAAALQALWCPRSWLYHQACRGSSNQGTACSPHECWNMIRSPIFP
jgi:hypothetical protein